MRSGEDFQLFGFCEFHGEVRIAGTASELCGSLINVTSDSKCPECAGYADPLYAFHSINGITEVINFFTVDDPVLSAKISNIAQALSRGEINPSHAQILVEWVKPGLGARFAQIAADKTVLAAFIGSLGVISAAQISGQYILTAAQIQAASSQTLPHMQPDTLPPTSQLFDPTAAPETAPAPQRKPSRQARRRAERNAGKEAPRSWLNGTSDI